MIISKTLYSWWLIVLILAQNDGFRIQNTEPSWQNLPNYFLLLCCDWQHQHHDTDWVSTSKSTSWSSNNATSHHFWSFFHSMPISCNLASQIHWRHGQKGVHYKLKIQNQNTYFSNFPVNMTSKNLIWNLIFCKTLWNLHFYFFYCLNKMSERKI